MIRCHSSFCFSCTFPATKLGASEHLDGHGVIELFCTAMGEAEGGSLPS